MFKAKNQSENRPLIDDSETGWYYLQSRYYDPEVGRYINGDNITDGGSGVLGSNLFMYAKNDPINNEDPSGNCLIKSAIKWVAKHIVKPVVKTGSKNISQSE